MADLEETKELEKEIVEEITTEEEKVVKPSLKDRFNVSCSMNLGYELDPTTLSEIELEEVKKQVKFYKEHRELIQLGKSYRISYKDIMKGILIEKDDEYLLFIYLLKDQNFEVKLPKVFTANKVYSVNGEKVSGEELNKKLPQSFVEDMKIDKNYTVEIDSKIIHIK